MPSPAKETKLLPFIVGESPISINNLSAEAKSSKTPNKWLRCYDVESLCPAHLLPGQIPSLHHVLTSYNIWANHRWLIDCLCLFVFTQSPTASPGCQKPLVSCAESSQQQTLTWLWHLEQSTNVKPSWQLLFLRQCARRGGIYRSEITIYLPSILSLLSQAVHFTKKFSYFTFIMSSIL